MLVQLCRIKILRLANDGSGEERIRVREVRAHVRRRVQIEHIRSGLARRIQGTTEESERQALGSCPLRLRRHRRFCRVRLPQPQSLVGEKEKSLVPANWPADGSTELVSLQSRDASALALHRTGSAIGPVEVILCVETPVAEVLEQTAMERVGAAL